MSKYIEKKVLISSEKINDDFEEAYSQLISYDKYNDSLALDAIWNSYDKDLLSPDLKIFYTKQMVEMFYNEEDKAIIEEQEVSKYDIEEYAGFNIRVHH